MLSANPTTCSSATIGLSQVPSTQVAKYQYNYYPNEGMHPYKLQ